MSVKGPLEKVDEDHCSVSSPLSESTSPQPIRATVYSIEVLLFDGMISNATVFESVDLDDKFLRWIQEQPEAPEQDWNMLPSVGTWCPCFPLKLLKAEKNHSMLIK